MTMNCLGGFAAGKLASYPCLGFMQMLDDGGQGVCEAMPDDTVSMLMARILTGRPGFVSDPALDTSKNQIVYAHCGARRRRSDRMGRRTAIASARSTIAIRAVLVPSRCCRPDT